ncbi:MAG: response regulator [Anaerolineae bacterium]|nr:response regulator [Anaerolineae bacterium]
MSASCVLIVEHDPAVRSLLQSQLQNDYELLFAEHGAEVPPMLRTHPVDLVLLDAALPGISGLDVLREIRSATVDADVPVILITQLSDSALAVRGLKQGANDYVTTPLSADVVRARVNTQLALRHAEDAHRQALSQLKFTQEMQENFTRIVSHDLKGPLTNIRMAQFVLRDILHDNSEARGILDNMDVTLNGMIDMIRVFLDAMDSQQLEPHIRLLNAHDLIVQVVEQYRFAAERKQIKLEMRDTDHPLSGDYKLLRQILGNLISNAIKFSPAGATVRVWAEMHEDRTRICISDEGPGILPEERDRLFELFSKLSARPTGGETSTGLGLWIVRQLVELQSGTVGVDQPEAGGSRFWIELPSTEPGR